MSDGPPVYFPVFLDLRGQRCLVVGGGRVARRKVEDLRAAGAVVTVVAPRIGPLPDGITLVQREFAPADLDGVVLVIAATNVPAVNAEVAREAAARRLWVNVVDDPSHCTFILPAVVRRGAFCLAVSTAGASPIFARRLRERLEDEFGPEYGALAELLWMARRAWDPRAKAAGLPEAARKAAWEAVMDLPLLDWLRDGEREQANAAIQGILTKALHGHG